MRDIDLLHPELRDKCRELSNLAKSHGIQIMITQTWRSEAEQNALYAQGRTKPGMVVTQVRYPYSLHCWGLAFDFAVVVEDNVNWSRTDLYKKVGELGKFLGLEWGGDFKSLKDLTHFQLRGYEINNLIAKYGTPAQFAAGFKEKQEPSPVFQDIVGHWAQSDVEWLAKNGIVQQAKYYRPHDPLTRAEAASLIRRTIEYVLKAIDTPHT